jgi:hypothetical protein
MPPDGETFLRPPVFARTIVAICGLLFVGVGLSVVVLSDSVGGRVTGAIIAAVGLASAIRLFRAGIVLRPDSLTIRGLLRSRTIHRSRISAIHDGPYVEWVGADGVSHESAVFAFMVGASSSDSTPGTRARARAIRDLSAWLGRA